MDFVEIVASSRIFSDMQLGKTALDFLTVGRCQSPTEPASQAMNSTARAKICIFIAGPMPSSRSWRLRRSIEFLCQDVVGLSFLTFKRWALERHSPKQLASVLRVSVSV